MPAATADVPAPGAVARSSTVTRRPRCASAPRDGEANGAGAYDDDIG